MNGRGAAGLLAACGTLMFCTPPAGAVPPPDPDVRVSPSTVYEGKQTTAYGEGFCPPPKCSEVSILLDGQRVASGPASRQGTFALSFRANTDAGGHRVSAVQSTPQGVLQTSTGMVVRSRPTTTTKPPATTTTTRPTTTTRRPSTSRSTTTTATTAESTTVESTSVGIETTTTSSTSSRVLPAAGAADDISSGYVSLIWWLVPSAVGALIVIGLIAWRQRPTGNHDSRML